MHELGLLRSVVSAVERSVARTVSGVGPAPEPVVEEVGLRVGSLSGAVPDALLGAWPIAVAGTTCEGARLAIETVPAAIWCPACAGERPVDEFYALTCPACGTPSGNLVRGREFEVAYADLADEPDPPHS